jgi:hypothetical protein
MQHMVSHHAKVAQPIAGGLSVPPLFGGCSSVVEHRIVASGVGGSIPLTHPKFKRRGPRAQVMRRVLGATKSSRETLGAL